MSGWTRARTIEARGVAILLPYLLELADGRVVVTSKGRLARFLQLEIGDVVFNTGVDTVWTAEIKIEEKHTGNLFLETWSNRNFTNPSSYAERPATTGWMYHTRADLLLYYFIDTDDLYTIDMYQLKRWAFGVLDSEGRNREGILHKFPERVQRKHDQMNETCGRVVAAKVIANALGKGFRQCKVRQLSLLEEAA